MSLDVAVPLQHWSSSSLGLAVTLDALHTGVRCIVKWPYSVLTLYGYTNDGHFAYGTLRLLFGHFAYWTLRLLVISPTRHFAYWTVRVLDISPTTWAVRLQIALHFTNKTTNVK